MKKKRSAIEELRQVMARLRSPGGCPWDREQDHMSLRWHAVEEVYELIDAIEARDDQEMLEELGDVLLQVIFHCQLAEERRAFNFDDVARHITTKLIRRHPHVFGDIKVKNVDEVWKNWETIKRNEKTGTRHARPSVLDGIPRRLPALLRAQKLIKKAKRAKLSKGPTGRKMTSNRLGQELFHLVALAETQKVSAEELLRRETFRQEKALRRLERSASTLST